MVSDTVLGLIVRALIAILSLIESHLEAGGKVTPSTTIKVND